MVILADHPLEEIFIQDQGDHGHDESHILMDDLGLKRVSAPIFENLEPANQSNRQMGNRLSHFFSIVGQEEASRLSIFSGEEERFAFQRTVSRLTEMQTEEYWLEGDRSTKSPA